MGGGYGSGGAAGAGYWGSGGGAGAGAGAGGGTGSGASSQSWQKSTSDVLFPVLSVGGKEKLPLTRMRVATLVEGLRTRTVVDHVFENPHPQALEGTFRFPLPPEAGISYFAMFAGTTSADPEFFGPTDSLLGKSAEAIGAAGPDLVVAGADTKLWGTSRVARVVRSVEATKAYEAETEKKIDPALVEQVAPNTFQARVFPVPAMASIRLLVAYEQTLPRVGATLEYELPLPKGAIDSYDFTLTAPKLAVSKASYVGSVAGVSEATSDTAFTFTKSLQASSPGGSFDFTIAPVGTTAEADALSGTDPGTKESYFVARAKPSFGALGPAEGGSSAGVFLVDTSFSEHPDQFGVNVKILEGILKASPTLAKFGIVTFDASARWLGAKWFANTATGRAEALAALGKVMLEGATDFGSALAALASPPPGLAAGTALDAFVLSDGMITWGDTGVEQMVTKYETKTLLPTRFFAYRTGLAADNLELFAALTRRGAIFNCYSEQSIAGCSTAHHATGIVLTSVTVEGSGAAGAQASNIIVAGRQATLFPGAEILVAGQLLAPGPAVLRLVGKTKTQAVDLKVPLSLTPAGSLAPRAWAEIAVSQLVQTRDKSLEGIAMALSQRYRVASRLGSFLVLESENDYTEYKLEDETQKFTGQSIAALVSGGFAKLGAGFTTWDRLSAVISDYADLNHVPSIDGGKLLTTVKSSSGAAGLELPPPTISAPAIDKADAPVSYLSKLTHDPWTWTPFIDEAERRRSDGDVGGGLRALSTVVENNPSYAELERLVGYRLDAWGRRADAANLLLHVLERRPFEPQSYRDLANALWTDRPGPAMLLFEGVLAGSWNSKFGGFKQVVLEEYSLFGTSLAKQQPAHPLNGYLAQRKQTLGLPSPEGDLRVTITWNTNDTDIDLWVTDPWGERCYYSNPTLKSGGELTDDLTEGYGPERFLAKKAVPGTYTIEVQYYGNNGNQLSAETYVNVTVLTRVGTPDEKIERFNIVLAKVNDVATVAKVKL